MLGSIAEIDADFHQFRRVSHRNLVASAASSVARSESDELFPAIGIQGKGLWRDGVEFRSVRGRSPRDLNAGVSVHIKVITELLEPAVLRNQLACSAGGSGRTWCSDVAFVGFKPGHEIGEGGR